MVHLQPIEVTFIVINIDYEYTNTGAEQEIDYMQSKEVTVPLVVFKCLYYSFQMHCKTLNMNMHAV